MKIIAKNYRCFSSAHPLKIEIKDGVTAFVGINNSGKSAVLKFFYELKDLFNVLQNQQSLFQGGGISANFSGVKHQLEPHYKFNDEPLDVAFIDEEWEFIVRKSRDSGRWHLRDMKIFGLPIVTSGDGLIITGLDLGSKKVHFAKREGPNQSGVDFYYEDIFKKLAALYNSIYFPAFRNIINVGGDDNFYGIPVGQSFIKAWSNIEKSDNPVIREKSIQIQKDLQEIFGYRSLDIRSSPENNQIIVNINDRSFSLSELGSGLSQFILVFITAATKEPDYILIDEPELNLHPRLQIDFINRLLKYSKKGMLIATHSLGLAHSVAQGIYSINQPKGTTESLIKPFENTPKFTEFLGELNFSGFPDLGFKKVLLVEGPTDVPVFSALLRKKNKYQNYLIWPLGGSSMINGETAKQLSELKRLGDDIDIHCWIDSEVQSEEQETSEPRKKFKKNCKDLGIEVTISKYRSIENYFPLEVIQKINPKIETFGPYDAVPDGIWDKGSNWRMASELDLEQINTTDLYKFIQEL